MCSVVGCDSGRRNAQRFKLPEDPEERLEWAVFIAKSNKQRFKESSWTDITVCGEHFTEDCWVKETDSVQLKPGAVPSVCLKPEPEPESCPGTEESGVKAVVDDDQLKTYQDSAPRLETSVLSSLGSDKSPVHTEPLCSAGSPECLQENPGRVSTDLIKSKAALLKKEGMFPVNEKRLLQLFSRKCPSCGGKLKTHKVTCGVVVDFNQLCLQCDYTHQWKSQVDSSVPAAEDKPMEGNSEAEAEDEAPSRVSDVPEIVAVLDEESDSKSEESSDPGDMDSDEDWKPVQDVFPVKMFRAKPNNESNKLVDFCDYLSLTPIYSQLCTDCGRFYDGRKPHTCEHKIKPHSCYICGKRCVNELALSSHNRIHDDNYEFRCKYCQATFKLKADKFTHEQFHIAQEKPYKCPDCSKTFATNQERKVHLEDHRGIVELKCRFCGIEFHRGLSIQRHLLVHTGEKPFKCSVCQRGFNQASHLKSHMRLHTGERPYKCQHCDKRFNHNVSLKSHLQRYHTSSSKPEQKETKKKSNTRVNGYQRYPDLNLDSEEEEEDTDDEMDELERPKPKKRCTGRPIGRPKSFELGKSIKENQAKGRRSKTGNKKSHRKRKKQLTDEDSEDRLSDTSLDSEEEKSIKNTAGSRKKNGGKNLGKRRGRPKKTIT